MLQRGYLVGTSSRWRIAIMRPGSAPLQELTQSLAAREVFDAKDPAALRGVVGPQQLWAGERRTEREKLRAGKTCCWLFDQFEELFRFAKENRHPASKAEAALFVSLLIEATEAFNEPVYVVLTMRWNFCVTATTLPRTGRSVESQPVSDPAAYLKPAPGHNRAAGGAGGGGCFAGAGAAAADGCG